MLLEAEEGEHGEEIKVGDAVFDVAHGAGKVLEIKEQEQKLVVGFGHRRFVYRPNGVGPFKQRTLFWCVPYVGIPMKNDMAWKFVVELFSAALKIIRKKWL